MNWDFHPAARAEFHASVAWYENQKPGLGDRFVQEIQRVIQRILERPERWRIVQHDARWLRANRFPCAVIYRQRGGAVEILAVMHLRRQPGYWFKRLES